MRDYVLCVNENGMNRLMQIYGSVPEVFRLYTSLSCILERNGIHDDNELSRQFLETSERLKIKGKIDEHVWKSLSH